MNKSQFENGELLEIKRNWTPEQYLYQTPRAFHNYIKGDLILVISQSDNRFTIMNMINYNEDVVLGETLSWMSRSVKKPDKGT